MSKDELSQRSRELDRKLQKDFDSSARVIKLLLLGTGSIIFYSNYSCQATRWTRVSLTSNRANPMYLP